METRDNSEFEQFIQSHLGFCLNFSFLLHSAALKYKVLQRRGRPTSGRSVLRGGLVSLCFGG